MSRREFVSSSARMGAGLASGTLAAGALVQACKGKGITGGSGSGAGEPPPDPASIPTPVESTFVAGSIASFPYIEVAGTPREIGAAAGKRFAEAIRASIERRADWWKELQQFASSGEGKAAVAGFAEAARKHAPRAFAELEGWSEGSGVALMDLLVLNHKSEIEEILKRRAEAPALEPHAGCSTIVLAAAGGRLVHLHNEDGHDSQADLMFVMKARPEGAPAWTALVYPGILPGNAPGFNDKGIAVTTNYIASREVRIGIGRYFLDRMILEASTLDEALRWSSHPERSYAFHHVLSDLPAGKAKAIEVTTTDRKVIDVEGLYLHTNHLVLEGLEGKDQDQEYVSTSSMTRWNVLQAWAKDAGDQAELTRAGMLEALASHEGKPFSPCRHPEGEVHGFTLATAIFESPALTMRVYKNQPCLDRPLDYGM